MTTKTNQTSLPIPTQRDGGRAKRGEVVSTLLAYLDKHIGITVHRDEIATDTGLSQDQVKQGMYGLYYKDVLNARTDERLEVVVQGRAWRWKSAKPQTDVSEKSKPIYEEVFTTEKGTTIVQGEDKSLYALKPLEI